MSNKPTKNKPSPKDRGKTVKLAALNVAMHVPHSAERYVQMLQDAFDLDVKVSLGNLHVAMLGQLDKPERIGSDEPITGEIFRFIKIDPSDPWFDTKTNKPAEKDAVKEIHIPDYLLPHLQRVPFAFFPKEHKLVFVSSMGKVSAYGSKQTTLGPKTAQRVFEEIFSHPDLLAKFKQIHVTVIPASEQVKKILNLSGIKVLEIELTRPNPGDDAEDESERLVERMQNQNVKTQTIIMQAEHNAAIKPDAETRDIAEEAAQNGRVEVRYKSSKGRIETMSTTDKPRIEAATLFESTQTLAALLKESLLRFKNNRT